MNKAKRSYGKYKLYKSIPANCSFAKEDGHQSAVWEIARKAKHEYWHSGICLYKKSDGWRFEDSMDYKVTEIAMRNYDIRMCEIALERLEGQRFGSIDESMQAFRIVMDIANDQRRQEVIEHLAREKKEREH